MEPSLTNFRPDPTMGSRHPLRVLVVDDNFVNQKVAIKFFAKLGYQADVAQNGLEAIRMHREESYHFILMDICMPIMDGIEASQQILRDDSKNIPCIVALSASFTEEQRKACRMLGVKSTLDKPLSIETLSRELEDFIKTLK